jgi:hypothetical protein
MELTFLGHQTWMISHKSSCILIDPILKDSFGAEAINRIEIFPPRTIEFNEAPKPNAVILTHEHSDHFHIPSLNLISRDTEIITGPMMIEPVVECINKLGFQVNRKSVNQSFLVGELEITLYSAPSATVFWESRVTQVYVRSVDEDISVFVAVDALVSERFKDDLDRGAKLVPKVIAVSNNAQITPKGVFGSLDNLLLGSEEGKVGLLGLDILQELLISYLDGLPRIDNIVICGGGFMKGYEGLGAFPFSDQKRLAEIAQHLSKHVTILGPRPGDSFIVNVNGVHEKRVSWIQLNQKRFKQLIEQQILFTASNKVTEIESICGQFTSETEAKHADQMIKNEMSKLALPLMLSRLGQLAVEMTDYLEGKLNSKRILFRFLSPDRSCRYQLVLDVNRACFIDDFTPSNEILRKFPYGIECFANDFYHMLLGDIQIWDIAGVALHSWYVAEKLESPVSFLYIYFGEHIQSQTVKRFYEKCLENTESSKKIIGGFCK